MGGGKTGKIKIMDHFLREASDTSVFWLTNGLISDGRTVESVRKKKE